MSNTVIQGPYIAPSATHLNQTYTINEGTLTQGLLPIVLSTSNYSSIYTATFTITGTSQSPAILLNCSSLHGLTLERISNVYTLTSIKTIDGIVINNQPYFQVALRNLSLQFTNTDISQSFSLNISISDGITNLIGSIDIIVAAIPDVTGSVQTVIMPMGLFGDSLTTAGGTNVVIADPNQAAKTYRVTYTVNDATNGSGTSDLQINNSVLSTSWEKTFTVSGTQSYINSVIASSGMYNGLFFFNYSPDFIGNVTVSYLQEVLTSTEVGAIVPYIQETGLLTLNVIYTAPYSVGSNPTYVEDSSTTFSLGTITDLAGDNWNYETCGTGAGLNCYTVTAIVTGTFSGTNPVVLTYSGDSSIDNTITFTGTKTAVNSLLSSVQLIPPADYIDPLIISITVARGTTPVTLFTGNITATCSSSHNEYVINGSHTFALGSNTWNIGSITDLAVSKSYSITLDLLSPITATMSSAGSGGTSSWNGSTGYGRLTITGNKTQVNSHLSTINFTTSGSVTLDDYLNISYTQTQTTNSISQGGLNFFVGNTINWHATNFTYNQDVTTNWDFASLGGQIDAVTTYTAKIHFSTPLSTANLGSVNGWIRETDYIWTLSGVKSVLISALGALVVNPPAQLITGFTTDIYIYDGATLIADTVAQGSTRSVSMITPIGITWTGANLSYNQDTATTWSNVATLNSNFDAARTYTIQLITSIATGGTLTGWTITNTTTFSKTDTKANLQSALNSLEFIPGLTFVSNFTFILKSYRSSLLLNTSGTKSISIGTLYSITPTSTALSYNQDNTATWASFASVSSNFDTAKTYTITLTSSVSLIGTFTGWTTASTTTFTKTDTGANLITALSSVVFIPSITLSTNFIITFSITRSSTVVATSWGKSVSVGLIYSAVAIGSSLTWDQNATKTYANMFSLSSNFNNSNTYTFTLGTSSGVNSGFTGWAASGSYELFTKTDTGANLIAALSSLELIVGVGTLKSAGNITVTLTCRRSSTNVATAAKILNIGNYYDYAVLNPTYNYGTTTNLAIAQVNNYWVTNPPATYYKVNGINSAVGMVADFVSDPNIYYTFDPVDYLTYPKIVNPIWINIGPSPISLLQTAVDLKSLTFTPINLPTVTFNGSTDIRYIIGSNTSLPIAITGIPNDGTTYKVLIQVLGSQIITSGGGNTNSPLGTWSYYTDGTYNGYITNSWLTQNQLADAIAGLRLFTISTSTLQQDLSPAQIRYQIYPNASVSLPWISSNWMNLYNGAKINLAATNFLTPKNTTTHINAGSYIWPGSVVYLNSSITYTLKIETKSAYFSISGWVNEGGNIYSTSGTPSTLSSILSNIGVTVTSSAGNYVDSNFRLYQAGSFISDQVVRLRIS